MAETAVRAKHAQGRNCVRGQLIGRGLQPRDGSAEMRFGCVPELDDQRMPLECLLNDPALDACAASVNEPNFNKPSLVRGADVLLDHGGDIARSKGVQVKLRFDGDAVGHLGAG